MARILIGLGSNLGNRKAYIAAAIAELQQQVGEVFVYSSLYQTSAMLKDGQAPQPDYLNAAIAVESDIRPHDLLRILLGIERHLGRVRNTGEGKWQPRTIDLDIIAIDSTCIASADLTLPHPELHRRAFVLKPLHDIAPDWIHPQLGKSVRELLAEVSCETIYSPPVKLPGSINLREAW